MALWLPEDDGPAAGSKSASATKGRDADPALIPFLRLPAEVDSALLDESVLAICMDDQSVLQYPHNVLVTRSVYLPLMRLIPKPM